MSMSADGYIAGPNDEPNNPGGDGFLRLHEWISTPDATGAVLAGGRTVKQLDHWGGGNHDGVPDLRAESPAARPVGRELPAGDVRERWDRERDGSGEGRGRRPERS